MNLKHMKVFRAIGKVSVETNREGLVGDVVVGCRLGLSDHEISSHFMVK